MNVSMQPLSVVSRLRSLSGGSQGPKGYAVRRKADASATRVIASYHGLDRSTFACYGVVRIWEP